MPDNFTKKPSRSAGPWLCSFDPTQEQEYADPGFLSYAVDPKYQILVLQTAPVQR
ncbi:predicted protein [Pyrenophora tritici-repentis Pt-1C-BFP]|uniref:Uncharacterized protein n=1 Tax=Pyrenophora tritici-repentis (strain Pt-1C-BFP) TaxID=426418 RepID=B2WN81_PYRTR|nr:uncharacterized protein PTRG_11530 [Pyrenophora tritici-repentis Pt-1C-BFP]EDU44580.1 predicted protein [Pyrenophora tritici-repentis Pt-1C-BFP]